MKLKALLLALFVSGFSASYALADDGHGKGDKGKSEDKAESKGGHGESAKSARCRPSVEVELRGTVAAAPGAASLVVLVTRGGAEGASLTGKQLTFDTTSARKPTTLASGDTVQVKGRACVDLVAGTVKLVAERVEAKRAESKSTTSTTTTTSTSTSTTTVASTPTTTTR
jgi:hypothetical protein